MYRHLHPTIRRYSWRKKNPIKQARLDFFLASSNMSDIITKCDIKPSYRSDHSIIQIDLLLNKFNVGKGIWKFNNSLLEIPQYISLINETITEELIKYALPVYNLDFIKTGDNDLFLTIDYDCFLELLFLRIRGETIKFASHEKQKNSRLENQLIKDIEYLEMRDITLSSQLLMDKKAELETLRKRKIKGEIVRARVDWLKEGERPTKFFCNLENRNFVEKTVKKVQLPDGSIITEQKEVLHHMGIFYSNLFGDKDNHIDFEKMGSVLKHLKIPKANDYDLGMPITVEELGTVLKQCKHNKSPGMDGITSEFLKIFWIKLKYIITNAINSCFMKGQLSTTLSQCVITCLPKGHKDRTLLKNWRPISLLCVVYKLASGVIARRLKTTLDSVISHCQTGFINGRMISESTRLVYDIMHFTETKQLPGLLMLIDFEKAFDSLSWSFLYKVLHSFGYSKNFIKWIKLFNTNISAYVLQCGHLSEKILIQRGCRQGDPISAYLFLLGAEIMSLMVISNPDIVGIMIGQYEYNLVQFADDTTLMLDGTLHSLQSALNTLEIFGSISGLRMNKDKTKLIWIGRKKFVKDKLNISEKLTWGETDFSLLGLEFSTFLDKIPLLNYNKALGKMKMEVNKWNKRHLTPFGKIVVIKTNILSKCIHLLSSIERSDTFLKAVNKLIYDFLWDGKPDKIKRSTMTNDYLLGGMKMVDIYNFDKALKVSWVKRLLCQTNSLWNVLFRQTHENTSKILHFGDNWCDKILPTIKIPFWKDVIGDWSLLCKKQQIKTNSDILQSCLWYNSKIFKSAICFPDCTNNEIYLIGDIVSPNGKIMDKLELESKYNIKINFLNYLTVRSSLTKFLKQFWSNDSTNTNYCRPSIPTHIKPVINSQRGCKLFYNIFKGDNTTENNSHKIWNNLLYNDGMLTERVWCSIYKICFKTIADNNIIWFQYKILFNILSTKKYLHKLGITSSPYCSFCKQHPESTLHLLSECDAVITLWNNVCNWIHQKIGIDFNFSKSMKILGYLVKDSNFWPVNFILLLTRRYIFWCSRKGYALNIFSLQLEVKQIYLEQQMLQNINQRGNYFDNV